MMIGTIVTLTKNVEDLIKEGIDEDISEKIKGKDGRITNYMPIDTYFIKLENKGGTWALSSKNFRIKEIE